MLGCFHNLQQSEQCEPPLCKFLLKNRNFTTILAQIYGEFSREYFALWKNIFPKMLLRVVIYRFFSTKLFSPIK
jgi:hypothetical protein